MAHAIHHEVHVEACKDGSLSSMTGTLAFEMLLDITQQWCFGQKILQGKAMESMRVNRAAQH